MEGQKIDLIDNTLNKRELQRYARHLILPEIGWEGQNRLKHSRVLVVGAGGLGSPVVLYLAAAGVGVIGLADADTVDESNLQRQIIYDTRDIGRSKTEAVRDRIAAFNPLSRVITFDAFLTSGNAMEVIRDFDVVVDCSDNFPTRYLVNDACVLLDKPEVFGAVYRFEGQASVFGAENGPCYRCFFTEPPEPETTRTCVGDGVLGVLPGVIGCIQATEAVKVLLGSATTLAGRLLLVDAWKMRFREIALRQNPQCPICGTNPSIRELIDYWDFCGIRRDDDGEAVQHIDAAQLKELLAGEPRLQIVEVREPHEMELVELPNRLILPLNEVVRRQNEFDPAGVVVFVCKFGIRSESAVRLLQDSGYRGKTCNLRDGLFSWLREIERPAIGNGL